MAAAVPVDKPATAMERTGTLRFAPLQGVHFIASVPEPERLRLPDSLILRMGDGTLRIRSDAVIAVLESMGGLWTGIAWLLHWTPRPLRDWGYDVVGTIRYQVFGRAPQLCPIATPDLRHRLIAD